MDARCEQFFQNHVRVLGKTRGLSDPTQADVTVIANNHKRKLRAGMVLKCIDPGADILVLHEGVEKDKPAQFGNPYFGITHEDALGWDNEELIDAVFNIKVDSWEALQARDDTFRRGIPIREQSLLDEIDVIRERYPGKRIAVFIGDGHVQKGTDLLRRLTRERPYTVAVLNTDSRNRRQRPR